MAQKLLRPDEFRLSSSNGQTKSKKAIEAGVEVRRGDFKDPATFAHAFEGAEALFLVSYPSVGEERFKYHRGAIDAAKAAGVKHVLYTSLTFGGVTGESSVAGVKQAHIQTVRYLKASGLKWTILRYPTYNHLWNNFAGFLQLEAKGDAEVVMPDDGPNHWASRDDLGEATAHVLANWVCDSFSTLNDDRMLMPPHQRSYESQTVNFTGPELLSISDIVELYSKHTGRRVDIRLVGVDKAIEYHKQHKTLPPDQEDFLSNWASWHVSLARGEANFLDPALENLLGRKPRTVADMANTLFEPQTNILDTKDFA